MQSSKGIHFMQSIELDEEMVEVKIYPYTIYSLMIDIGGMFNSLFFIGLILIYHF